MASPRAGAAVLIIFSVLVGGAFLDSPVDFEDAFLAGETALPTVLAVVFALPFPLAAAFLGAAFFAFLMSTTSAILHATKINYNLILIQILRISE